MRLVSALPVLSAVARNSLVPDLAMVPRFLASSVLFMPMPVSRTMTRPVLPPSSLSIAIVMFASPALRTSRFVRLSRRSFSSASLALESSSRRNTSLCEYRL